LELLTFSARLKGGASAGGMDGNLNARLLSGMLEREGFYCFEGTKNREVQ
jgi:hypothetical protein